MKLPFSRSENFQSAACVLSGFDDFKCSHKLQRHHFISKGRLRGATAARVYVQENVHFFLVPCCSIHNAWTKMADCRKARKWILERYLVPLWGEEYCREMIDNVPWKVPSAHYDLSFDGIMGAD